jgi:hypothetical protein
MIDQNIPVVDITIGSNMYGRITDLPNTPSHVLAEFVDNALQSYRDKKKELESLYPDYRLKIEISFDWNQTTKRADAIRIQDNAGGIDSAIYADAFKLANTPENNQGLNEFGMGLKTAALWLGEMWSVKTKALGEPISRTIHFDLNEVLVNSLKKLVVKTEAAEQDEHYTLITISSLTNKAPSQKSIDTIKEELRSIYRKSLRINEADIIVDGEKLYFEEAEILNAPSTKSPQGPAVYWKKDIDFKFGKYRAKGFIGILKDMNKAKNGIVLLRRGRVVYGAEVDGRYYPKCLCGNAGSPRYKRLFGELELEGFAVSFNKNDLQDKEDLEVLMEGVKGEIHSKELDIYTQAEEYRVDERQKNINKIIRAHNSSKKKDDTVVVQSMMFNTPSSSITSVEIAPITLGQINDTYHINGKEYKLTADMVDKGKDLLWLDTSQKKENIVVCKINVNHVFFDHFGKPNNAMIALLKTMALAKFTAKEDGTDTTAEMFDSFNEYIKKTKV